MTDYYEIGKDTDGNYEMLVRFIFKGDSWGLNGCRTHDKDEPMVDICKKSDKQPDEPLHICYKYLTTIKECAEEKRGMCLCGATYLSLSEDQIDEIVRLSHELQREKWQEIMDAAYQYVSEFVSEPQDMLALAEAIGGVAAYSCKDSRARTIALPSIIKALAHGWEESVLELEEMGEL